MLQLFKGKPKSLPRVLNSLVDWEDEASSLGGRGESVDLHDSRLPHAGGVVVGDVLAQDVNAVPAVTLNKKFVCMQETNYEVEG